MAAPTAILADDFTIKDTAKWTFNTGTDATDGRATVVPTTGFPSIDSATTYNLVGSSFFAQCVQTPNIGNGTTQMLLQFRKTDWSFYGRIYWANGAILCDYNDGTGHSIASTTFDAVNHKWWRVRESAGTLYFDTSRDAIRWTTLGSTTYSADLTSVYIMLVAGYSGTEPSPGVAVYDNVNVNATTYSTWATNDLIQGSQATSMSAKVDEIEQDNTVQFARGDQLLATGIASVHRAIAGGNGNVLAGSGVLPLTYFTAEQALTVNNIFTRVGAASGASPTLCRFGLYTVASNGDLALVASTANDATLFNAGGSITKALSAGYNMVAGQRYAGGWLFVTSAAMPTIIGANIVMTVGSELALAPRLTGQVTSLTDLPSSVANASVANCNVAPIYFRLYT